MQTVIKVISLSLLIFLIQSCGTLKKIMAKVGGSSSDELVARNSQPLPQTNFLDPTQTVMTEKAIQKKAAQKREPASSSRKIVKKVIPNGAQIIYTPLWIKIPYNECLEIDPNKNYRYGACIRRKQ